MDVNEQENNTPEQETPETQPQESQQDIPQEPPQAEPEAKPEDQPKADVDEEQVKSLVEQAGLDFDVFQSEYEAGGKLSDESYQKLEAAGFPPEIVDAHIDGLRATEELQMQALYNTVGGEENLNQLLSWAGQHLKEEDINSFNDIAANGDMSQLTLALNGLKAQYESQNGSMQITSYSGTQPQITTDIFHSQDDVQEAMSDPRYGVNETYTKEVEAKMMRSLRAR
ncbi:hypothetical protein H0A36_28160 [Endozoicomonas sp. SM1973]|uniref:Capsid assembly protein n=1 Tax=Spartinivicinus marinus TaxID=2994442 RepID=A0A853IDF5_9GAMM|nr:hypothetical protein [Spartinivicinus marinus]MCX4025636.1 hypothetical protein [Spartinivicinus marinus]NYZ69892.1 hypothetical protein [Spartinivicinus marinus]